MRRLPRRLFTVSVGERSAPTLVHETVEALLIFLTREECRRLSGGWGPDTTVRKLALPVPKLPSRMYFVSRRLASEFSYDRPVLLWVTESDIWTSNWHLYYRLRQSYGDNRLIHDAPGHLCLNYETEDLATLLYLTMLNGWDAAFVPEPDYVRLWFSHDGFIDVFSDDDELVESVRRVVGDDEPAST